MKMEEDDSDERITPFMIFMVENRERILRKNPNASLAQLGRLVYEAWQGLSPEMMHGYSMLSETYNANITKQKNGTAVRRKRTREKDPEAPKAVTSAYMYYSKHHRNVLKKENSNMTFADLGKTIGAMWKAASAEEKKPFEDMAAEDKTRFASEMAAYKAFLTEKEESEGSSSSSSSSSNASSSAGSVTSSSGTSSSTSTSSTSSSSSSTSSSSSVSNSSHVLKSTKEKKTPVYHGKGKAKATYSASMDEDDKGIVEEEEGLDNEVEEIEGDRKEKNGEAEEERMREGTDLVGQQLEKAINDDLAGKDGNSDTMEEDAPDTIETNKSAEVGNDRGGANYQSSSGSSSSQDYRLSEVKITTSDEEFEKEVAELE